MIKNIKSLKQIDESGMNEYIARFAFQENNSSQDTYYDSIKNKTLYHSSQTATRKCQELQKMEIKISVKFKHASITKPSICAR